MFDCDFSAEQKRQLHLLQFAPMVMTRSALYNKHTTAEKNRLNALREKLEALENDRQDMRQLIKRDGSRSLVSLDFILNKKMQASDNEYVESYTMLSNIPGGEAAIQQDKTLIVKRTPLIFNDEECQVINFTDISAHKQLKQEQETNK